MALNIVRDFLRYPGPLHWKARFASVAPGFWAVASYRALKATYGLPRAVQLPVKLVTKPMAFGIQLLTGIEISPRATIGPGFWIGHWGGIVVHGDAVIGERCNISHGVTIGEAEGADGKRGVPVIGDRVYIGPGAKVFGPIRIGNDVAIGANAVVNRDVPDGVTVGGIPAKVISQRGSRGMIDIGQPTHRGPNVLREQVEAPAARNTVKEVAASEPDGAPSEASLR